MLRNGLADGASLEHQELGRGGPVDELGGLGRVKGQGALVVDALQRERRRIGSSEGGVEGAEAETRV